METLSPTEMLPFLYAGLKAVKKLYWENFGSLRTETVSSEVLSHIAQHRHIQHKFLAWTQPYILFGTSNLCFYWKRAELDNV